MSVKQLATILGGSILGAISISSISVYLLISKIYNDIKPQKPTTELFEEQKQNMVKNALFKLFPILKSNMAWISLGNYPSFVDTIKIELPRSAKIISILLKREDLVSNLYGGNKVRTLEYQLACAKIQLNTINKNNNSNKKNARWVSVGGSGSNQIVASSVYANQNNIPLLQYPFDGEGDAFDNGLNFVSSMSFPNYFSKPFWSLPITLKLKYFYHTFNNYNNVFSMPGGANVTGALGHVNAILELVEAVKNHNFKPPKYIFLPLGSSCTTSGLTAGLALIRKLNIGKSLHDVEIHAIGIHPGMNSIIMRKVVNSAIRKISYDVLKLIYSLGGVDATDELKNVYNKVKFNTNFAGDEYGQWTNAALLSKQIMTNGKIISSNNPHPWMDSCFSAKACAAMIEHIENTSKMDSYNIKDEECQYMFWCTKSIVQPILNKNAVKSNMEKLSKDHKEAIEWLKHCHISKEADYLPVMSKL